MNLYTNTRGLLGADFQDREGKECVIQEASFQEEPCLWIGVDANADGTLVQDGRILLTQALARELLPLLRHFSREGSLGEDDPNLAFPIGSWVRGVGTSNRNVEGRVVVRRQGEVLGVQDVRTPGVSGQIDCMWEYVDLMWEPAPAPPEATHSWIDNLVSED